MRRDRRKAFNIKGYCSAKQDPFCVIYDDNEAIQKAYVPIPARPEEELSLAALESSPAEKEAPKTDYGLTEKDRNYLRLKWGKNYNEDEWVQT